MHLFLIELHEVLLHLSAIGRGEHNRNSNNHNRRVQWITRQAIGSLLLLFFVITLGFGTWSDCRLHAGLKSTRYVNISTVARDCSGQALLQVWEPLPPRDDTLAIKRQYEKAQLCLPLLRLPVGSIESNFDYMNEADPANKRSATTESIVRPSKAVTVRVLGSHKYHGGGGGVVLPQGALR